MIASAGALGLTMAGLVLFLWIGCPLVRRLEFDAMALRQGIEERQRAEQQFTRSEDRYQQVFYSNLAVKLIIDPQDGRIVEANNAACRFYGYSAETLTTMAITDISGLSGEEVEEKIGLALCEQQSCFIFRHRLA